MLVSVPLTLTRFPESFFFMVPPVDLWRNLTPLELRYSSSAGRNRQKRVKSSKSPAERTGASASALPLPSCWSSVSLSPSLRCSVLLPPGSAALWAASNSCVSRCPVTPPPGSLLAQRLLGSTTAPPTGGHGPCYEIRCIWTIKINPSTPQTTETVQRRIRSRRSRSRPLIKFRKQTQTLHCVYLLVLLVRLGTLVLRSLWSRCDPGLRSGSV